MKADLSWIPGPWRGRLAIASRPRGGDWLDDEAGAWRQADIDVVVSLLENVEAAQLDLLHERQAAEDHAINFISFPIPDRGVPASMQEAVALIARIGLNWTREKTFRTLPPGHWLFRLDCSRSAHGVRGESGRGDADCQFGPRCFSSGDARAASMD